MQIITVRHAATTFHQEKRIAGRLDVPLADEGIADAQKARAIIASVPYHYIVSSPLSRALATAAHCTGLKPEDIALDEDCIERSYGKLEGLSPNEVRRLRPRVIYARVGRCRHSLNPPGGETFEQLRVRAQRFRATMQSRFGGQCVLVFSHYAFLQQLHGALLGVDPYNSLGLEVCLLEMNEFQLNEDGVVTDHARRLMANDERGSW